MLKPALLPLIRRVRSLLGEQDEDVFDCSFWADDAIADALDARALPVNRLALARQGEDADGNVIWGTIFKNWDEATILTNTHGEPVVAIHADLLAGKWAIAASVDQVYVSGSSYDLYGAAADLLIVKAVAKSANYDVQAGDQKLSRSQETAALQALAAQYRKKARPTSATIIRTDVR